MKALNNPSWVFDWCVKDVCFHRGLGGCWVYQVYIYQGRIATIAAAMAAPTFTSPGAGTE